MYYYSKCKNIHYQVHLIVVFQNILISRDYSNQLSEAYPEPVIVMIMMIMIKMIVIILLISGRQQKSHE